MTEVGFESEILHYHDLFTWLCLADGCVDISTWVSLVSSHPVLALVLPKQLRPPQDWSQHCVCVLCYMTSLIVCSRNEAMWRIRMSSYRGGVGGIH